MNNKIGLFDFNLVTILFQEGGFLTKLIYIIVVLFFAII